MIFSFRRKHQRPYERRALPAYPWEAEGECSTAEVEKLVRTLSIGHRDNRCQTPMP